MQRKRSARNGRVKTLGWREDPAIRARLRLVDQVYGQPAHRGLDIVNRQLQANGQAEISLDQYFTDRQHVRELLQADRPQGLLEHQARLLRKQAEIERDIQATQPGAGRAALYACWVRYQEDLMKIDGTWGRSGAEVGEVGLDEAGMGPSPQELLALGEIDREQYMQFLVLVARTTGGQRRSRTAPKPSGSKPVVEPRAEGDARGPLLVRGGVRHGLPEPRAEPDRPRTLHGELVNEDGRAGVLGLGWPDEDEP